MSDLNILQRMINRQLHRTPLHSEGTGHYFILDYTDSRNYHLPKLCPEILQNHLIHSWALPFVQMFSAIKIENMHLNLKSLKLRSTTAVQNPHKVMLLIAYWLQNLVWLLHLSLLIYVQCKTSDGSYIKSWALETMNKCVFPFTSW